MAARVRFARHPHPPPFAPSPPVGALASRSVGYPRVLDRPRCVIAMSALLAGGFRNLPPLVRPGLAHRPAAAIFNTLAAVVARHDRLSSWSSPWGLPALARPSACLWPGRASPAPGCSGSRCPPPARGLLRGGRYRPAPRGTRPATPGALATLGTSVAACGRRFYRLARGVARTPHDCFPSLAASRGLPIIRVARSLAGFRPFAGAHAARTPL